MARSRKYLVQRWKLLGVLSWVYLKNEGQRNSSSSCRAGRTRIQLLIKVSLSIDEVGVLTDLRLGIDLDSDSMKSVYEKFHLEPGTQDFIGHAMALYLDDEWVYVLVLR